MVLAKDYLDERSVEAQAWVTLGQSLVNASDTLTTLVASVSPDSRAEDRVAASHLQTYLNYYGPLDDPLRVAIKLFDLAATQRAMLPAGAGCAYRRLVLIALTVTGVAAANGRRK